MMSNRSCILSDDSVEYSVGCNPQMPASHDSDARPQPDICWQLGPGDSHAHHADWAQLRPVEWPE